MAATYAATPESSSVEWLSVAVPGPPEMRRHKRTGVPRLRTWTRRPQCGDAGQGLPPVRPVIGWGGQVLNREPTRGFKA